MPDFLSRLEARLKFPDRRHPVHRRKERKSEPNKPTTNEYHLELMNTCIKTYLDQCRPIQDGQHVLDESEFTFANGSSVRIVYHLDFHSANLERKPFAFRLFGVVSQRIMGDQSHNSSLFKFCVARERRGIWSITTLFQRRSKQNICE